MAVMNKWTKNIKLLQLQRYYDIRSQSPVSYLYCIIMLIWILMVHFMYYALSPLTNSWRIICDILPYAWLLYFALFLYRNFNLALVLSHLLTNLTAQLTEITLITTIQWWQQMQMNEIIKTQEKCGTSAEKWSRLV